MHIPPIPRKLTFVHAYICRKLTEWWLELDFACTDANYIPCVDSSLLATAFSELSGTTVTDTFDYPLTMACFPCEAWLTDIYVSVTDLQHGRSRCGHAVQPSRPHRCPHSPRTPLQPRTGTSLLWENPHVVPTDVLCVSFSDSSENFDAQAPSPREAMRVQHPGDQAVRALNAVS